LSMRSPTAASGGSMGSSARRWEERLEQSRSLAI
jgi:hypothetical protein